MRIAFAGKGGSGKTTLAAAFIRHLSNQKRPQPNQVIALDSDVNTHLAQALGMKKTEATQQQHLGANFPAVAHYFESNRAALAHLEATQIPAMGTIPPGVGSRLLVPGGEDEFLRRWALLDPALPGVHLLQVGGHEAHEVGDSCYHTKLNAAEMVVHRTLDLTEQQWLVADTTAGVDVVGTSLLIGYDLYAFVVEPTPASVQVVSNFVNITANSPYPLPCVVIPNKIIDAEDLQFLAQHLPKHLEVISPIQASDYLRDPQRFSPTEEPSLDQACSELEQLTRQHPRDWAAYTQSLHQLYRQRCRDWWNDFSGMDLERLVEPNFAYSTALTQPTTAGAPA